MVRSGDGKEPRMTRILGLAVSAALLATAACHRSTGSEQTGQAPSPAPEIAWREGDVDDAFAEAKEQNKPVLLYWGAKWCPPCNQMRQTLFRDPAFIAETRAFIAETRAFIPVHLDGDARGAQLWGEKFGIAGYPTVIILRPDRTEVTRLSGSTAAPQLADVLRVAATRTTSTEDLLRRADDPKSLSADDWRLLAGFDWLDDPKHFDDPKKTAAFLDRLAAEAPDPAVQRHFTLTALMTGAVDDKVKLTEAQQQQVRTVMPAILADYAEVKANREELSDGAADLVNALPDPAERKALGGRLVAALDRLAADASVSLGDRLATVNADITLAKAANGKVPPAVLAKVRARVAMADKAATEPQARQAVISDAGQLLDAAGDPAGAERLWKAELPHAVAPYYYMVDLADLAEKQKDHAAAIAWLRKAAETAEGPATRVQWAIMYSQGVMRMAPADKTAVEQSAGMVIDALGANSAGYAERTATRTATWAERLRTWSRARGGGEVLARLQARMAQACTGGRCKDVLRT
jgi:protein disulfide-isomerase